jgi:GcrA cell cycle regulator
LTINPTCSYNYQNGVDLGGKMLQGPIGLPHAPRRRPLSPWTKQRTRLLRRRWSQGARVREIAAELGHGITYNAVISKIHRLGISALSPYGGAPGRRFAAKTRPADRPVYADRAAWWFRKGPPPAWVVNAKPYVEAVGADARIPRRQRRSLLDLKDDTCRWPVGDPRSSRFFFCGAQSLRNKPYCAEHAARAARPPWRRRHPIRSGDETAVQYLSTGERG